MIFLRYRVKYYDSEIRTGSKVSNRFNVYVQLRLLGNVFSPSNKTSRWQRFDTESSRKESLSFAT